MLQKKNTTIIVQAIICINTGSIMVTNTDDSTTIIIDLEENTLNELEKKSEHDEGRTGLKRFLVGSVANGVVHHAHCPVLLVR
jgi:nucleotide-binding universal stress UspA family protein